MAILPIRTLGDPVLRTPARPVDRFDAALARLADDMLETMRDAPGVGLAAPQVGRSIQFFVYDDGSGPATMANPQLLDLEEAQVLEEGCLSIPGLFFATRRALRLRAVGRDVTGRPVEVVAEGFLARILQHETDHLNGTLYIARLDEPERREAMKAIREMEIGLST
jgi:peptide deformylase